MEWIAGSATDSVNAVVPNTLGADTSGRVLSSAAAAATIPAAAMLMSLVEVTLSVTTWCGGDAVHAPSGRLVVGASEGLGMAFREEPAVLDDASSAVELHRVHTHESVQSER
jgi:hypothetical protein